MNRIGLDSFEIWMILPSWIVGWYIDCIFKILLESMCLEDFTRKTEEETWEFLEEIFEKTLNYQSIHEKPAKFTSKGGIHAIKQLYCQR